MWLLMEALQGDAGWDLLRVNLPGSPSTHTLLTHTLWLRAGMYRRWQVALHPPFPYPLASKDTCQGSRAPVRSHQRTCYRHTLRRAQSKHPSLHTQMRLLATRGFRDKYTHIQICKGNSSSLKASTAGHIDMPDGSYAYPQHLDASP